MSNGKPKLHFLGLRSGWPLWAAAAATLAFGLVLLIWPGIATEWILNLCGAALLIAGAANIFRYYRRGDAYRAYNWDLSVGILLALAGLALIAFKAMLLSIVPLLFGIALLIGGAVKIQAACNLRRMRYGRWYLTMIGAVISFLLGALIIANPFATSLVLVRVMGAAIAVEAVQDLISMLTYKREVTTHFVD